jgi:hypothetical protein
MGFYLTNCLGFKIECDKLNLNYKYTLNIIKITLLSNKNLVNSLNLIILILFYLD